jgi:DNA primase
MIPKETLEQIAAANDIADVIGSYFPLKRAGSTFKALCPFHQEKSPSFTVNVQRQRYHCFGCGEGGSVFDFVAKYESVDFPTAARRLAERAGIQIVEQERTPGEEREVSLRKRLLAIHQQAAEWFHGMLMKTKAANGARAYLKQRGLTSDVAQRWKIGYAPNDFHAFISWAEGEGFNQEEIVQSGLVSLRDSEDANSDFYDRFRDRIMFPICNDIGEVVGFSGRMLGSEKQAAKYVNSPETSLFKKGDILFGLHKSKRALIEKESAIVLEGQIDLITAFEAGVQNVVAPQGTAFTEKQARTLKRYTKEVVLCFDADAAGQKAADRSLPALLGLDLGVRVIELPPGEDPDSLIRKEGADAFSARVKDGRDYFDFQIATQKAKPEFLTPQGRVQFARKIATTVEMIGDRLLREAVASRMARAIEMTKDEFWSLLDRRKIKPKASKSDEDANKKAIHPIVSSGSIGYLSLLALRDQEARRWIAAQPWSERIFELDSADLLAKILESDVDAEDPASLAVFTSDLTSEQQGIITRLMREKFPDRPIVGAHEIWVDSEKRDLARRRELLLARMRDPNLSPAEITEIQKQILDLQKLITDISRPLSPSGTE